MAADAGIPVLLIDRNTEGEYVTQVSADFVWEGEQCAVLLDDYFKGEEFNVVVIEGTPGMKQMKALYGDKILLMGNVDCGHILPYGTNEEIVDATIRCIQEGARGGGFCLTSSNSISGDITAKRFMTMVEAAKKYGQYPII